MNCNVYVFCKLIFSNKLGFILETVFSFIYFISLYFFQAMERTRNLLLNFNIITNLTTKLQRYRGMASQGLAFFIKYAMNLGIVKIEH